MPFVFSSYFIYLLIIGLLPLSLSWNYPILRWFVLIYDLILICLTLVDWKISQLPQNFKITRYFDKRFAIGDANKVILKIENNSLHKTVIYLKDEFPASIKLRGRREGMMPVNSFSTSLFYYEIIPQARGYFEFGTTKIRYLSKFRLIWRQTQFATQTAIKVYPNIRRAKEVELLTLGANSLISTQRRTNVRGEGRDFESMREYVRGDELRHISWTATARRGKLVTRQYQIEKDQTVLIALDAGRLMTGRIENESKLDSAIQAALSLTSAALRGGDNVGIVVFGRRVIKYVLPKHSLSQIDAILETLYDVEPEMVEPSYSRAFEFVAANLKRRALVVILTDLVDKEGSTNLLEAIKLLRPRHLPVVVTISDRDLKSAVQESPNTAQNLFIQGVAEEILYQREMALKNVEAQGGLALDVTAQKLAPAILETYLRVKKRGLL